MMASKGPTKLVILVGLVLLIVASAPSRPRKMQRVATGTWGATHIRVEVGQRSATIEYDCGNGTIDGPLTFDNKGRFSWRGTHHREGPGPVRAGDELNGRPAIYTGSIKGDLMTLTVKLTDTNEVLNTFALKRGSAGRVFKCR